MTKQNLIAAAFLKACQDHMLAVRAREDGSDAYLRAAMALEAAYPDVVNAVRLASRRQLKAH